MKNSELWQQYKEYTQGLSENSRKLAFGAAAICWIFKSPSGRFPDGIDIALSLVAAFFVADILQYLLGALFIRMWTRHHEKKQWKETESIDGDYQKPHWLDYPSYSLWWAKVVFLLLAYIIIGSSIFQ